MSFKTFTCVICGKEITKPQSYAVENGRACRCHQEAKNAHQERENVIEEKERKETDARPSLVGTHILYQEFDTRHEVNLIKNVMNIIDKRGNWLECDVVFDNIAIEVMSHVSIEDNVPYLNQINASLRDWIDFAIRFGATRDNLCAQLTATLARCVAALDMIDKQNNRYSCDVELYNDVQTKLCESGLKFCSAVDIANDSPSRPADEWVRLYKGAADVLRDEFQLTVAIYCNRKYNTVSMDVESMIHMFKAALGSLIYMPKFNPYAIENPVSVRGFRDYCEHKKQSLTGREL